MVFMDVAEGKNMDGDVTNLIGIFSFHVLCLFSPATKSILESNSWILNIKMSVCGLGRRNISAVSLTQPK